MILQYAGKDATEAYDAVHAPEVVEKNLPPEKNLGVLDAESTLAMAQSNKERKKTQDELRVEKAMKEIPPLSRVLNSLEMEEVAKKILTYKAWAFITSAADNEVSEYTQSLNTLPIYT